MKKLLYIVLDGLGDIPCAELGKKTPLEAADTSFMDGLARDGKAGLMYTVEKDIAPESDIAVISILGYEAKKHYTGRGPLECYAAGLKVEDGDLAYRVNFATLGNDREIVDRRVGRSLTTEEAEELSEAINSYVKLSAHPATFEFKNTVGHRGVLVIHPLSGRLSGEVTNTDPAYGKEGPFGVAKEKFENVLLKCVPVEGYKNYLEAINAAELTNEFVEKSHHILEEHPVNKKRMQKGKLAANLILTRDGGAGLPKFPNFQKRYNVKFGCFVEMPVEKGIALLTGMEVLELPLPTSDYASDFSLRAEKALEAMEDFGGLYIHLKGPDEPAHDGNSREKKKVIEAIDKYFFGELIPKIDIKNVIIAVTADHSTPCSLKAHSADPVPLMISGDKVAKDNTQTFSEKACKEGSLGTILSAKLLPYLIELAKS